MNRIVLIAATGLALAGCSKKDDGKARAPVEKSNIKIEFKSPVKFSADPAEKHGQQVMMVESMLADPRIPLDNVEGEALRRGVVLTDAQREAKRRQAPAKPGVALPGTEAPASPSPHPVAPASRP